MQNIVTAIFEDTRARSAGELEQQQGALHIKHMPESPVQREEKEGSTERAQTNGAFTQR